MSLSGYVVLGLVVIDVILLIYVTYLGHNFYSLRNILIFRKRQSNLTIFMGCLIAIQLIERPLVLIEMYLREENNDEDIEIYSTFVNVLQWTIDPFLSQGVLYLLLLKFYMIYYEINWTLSSLRLKWVLHINPGVGKQDKYLQNKKTYGDVRFVAKKYFWIYLLSSLFSSAFYTLTYVFKWLDENNNARIGAHLLETLLFVIPVGACIWLRRRTPSFFDHFYVRDEMNIVIALCVFNLIFYFAMIVFAIIWDLTLPIQLSMILFGALTLFVIFVVSTWWIVYLFKRDYGSIEEIKRRIGTTNEKGASFAFIVGGMKSNNNDHQSMADYIASTIPLDEDNNNHKGGSTANLNNKNNHKIDINNQNNNDNNRRYKRARTQSMKFREMDIKVTNSMKIKSSKIAKKLKLHQILSKDESFELFMQHLSKEYDNEACLLCFIEFVQFKQLLFKNLSGINRGTFGDPKLAASIPKSVIVYTGAFNTQTIARNSVNNNNMLISNAMVANNPSNTPGNNNNNNNNNNMNNSNNSASIGSTSVSNNNTNHMTVPRNNSNNSNSSRKRNQTNSNSNSNSNGSNTKDGEKETQTKMNEILLVKEYKCRAYLLYQKYIKTDGEFEIEFEPTSVQAREYKQTIVNMMDDLDNWLNAEISNDDLFHQFDTVIREMYKIMYQSYQEFLTTDDYKKCETLFKDHNTTTPGKGASSSDEQQNCGMKCFGCV